MFGISRIVPAVAVAAAVLATPVFAQSTETLRVNNRSGMTLYSLHASPTTNSSWENDLLGNNVLNSGRYIDVTIRNVTNCNYDVRLEFTNGQVLTDRVNVCSVGTYNINP